MRALGRWIRERWSLRGIPRVSNEELRVLADAGVLIIHTEARELERKIRKPHDTHPTEGEVHV